ncbi:MAG: 4a-hydroxytetrahydrobiopterin dehydratase [Acidobacteria bacterium]|jgi:4a-hydroxytetrahydrobiopterin dehydratase|nr:MAG: 4a-hydroxytetrahydrobiopterin dehydratase [Acidobacteriota bacterium]
MEEKLQQREIEEALGELPGWNYEGGYIRKEYITKNWKETVFLFNAIASLAEALWHHPDVELGYKRVLVKLQTHEVGGITKRDTELAKEIERLAGLILKR